MRIILFHQHFKLPCSSGSTRNFELVRRLIESGHDVTVVTGPLDLQENLIPEGLRIEIVKIDYQQQFSFARKLLSFVGFGIGSVFYALRLDCDLAIASSTPLTIGIPGLVCKLVNRCPLIFEVRDVWPEIPIRMGLMKSKVAISCALALEKIIYRFSDSIVALSPDMKSLVIEKGVPEGKIAVIPNACDFELAGRSGLDLEVSAINEIKSILREGKAIVYAGTIGRVNNVAYLAEAAKVALLRFPLLKFVVIGEGSERQKLASKARIDGTLGVNFFIFDPVPKSQIFHVISLSAAVCNLVAPVQALGANSANKFFDGLACGKPILLNHGGWMSDLVEGFGCGIVLEAEPCFSELERLENKLSDESWLNAASSAALHLGKNYFDRDKLFEQYLCVIRKVISGQAFSVSFCAPGKY